MVGTWNTTSPDGTKSVQANQTIIQNNTTYLKANLDLDHYWDSSANNDGHHRFVQSPKSETAGTPTDPTLATGMDGAFYYKEKTAAESPDNQNVLPFFKDALVTPSVMEMLGIRACCLFEADATIKYAHNIASVVNDATGQYTITYTTALPSNNYLVMAGCAPGETASTQTGIAGVKPDTVAANVKSTTKVVITTRQVANTTTQLIAPTQGWLVCFGG